jgi:hypothetical protein
MNDMKTSSIERKMYSTRRYSDALLTNTHKAVSLRPLRATSAMRGSKAENPKPTHQKSVFPTSPMTKLEIINHIYSSHEYYEACTTITGGKSLSDDLFHEMILVLMKYDDAKITSLYDRNELKWFVVRIMMTMWRCRTNPFFRTYRRRTDSINERIHAAEEEYDAERDLAMELAVEVANKVIEEKLNSGNRNDWYDATMWKLYLSAGSFRKAEEQSKIPYKSIANTVRRMKLIIEERIKLEAGNMRRKNN